MQPSYADQSRLAIELVAIDFANLETDPCAIWNVNKFFSNGSFEHVRICVRHALCAAPKIKRGKIGMNELAAVRSDSVDQKAMTGLGITQSEDGYFVPWTTDASALLGRNGRDRDKLRRLQLVIPTGIGQFETNGVLVLAGNRGTGKSLVLARKAAQLLEDAHHGSYLTLCRHSPFVNELVKASVTLPANPRSLGSHSRWVKLWQLVLWTHAACMVIANRDVPNQKEVDPSRYIGWRYFGFPQPASKQKRAGARAATAIPDQGTAKGANEELTEQYFFLWVWDHFRKTESISSSLSLLTGAGLSDEDLKSWTKRAAEAYVKHGEANAPLTIFVDAIDEAIGSPDGRPLIPYLSETVVHRKHDPSREGMPAAAPSLPEDTKPMLDAWLHIQTGFAMAADTIFQESRQTVCIYGAIRREAGIWLSNPSKSGVPAAKVDGAIAANVAYTPELLRNVFELNVFHTKDGELFDASRKKSSPVIALFGFDTVSHSRVFNAQESLVSLLVRHTFGAPRELTGLAAAAKNACLNPAKRPDSAKVILDAIDDYARATVFKDFVTNVSPPWNTVLAEAVRYIKKNVLDRDAVARIEDQAKVPNLFSALYSRGLVGLPNETSASGRRLTFLEPDANEHSLPLDYAYLAIHPALSAFLVPGLPHHDQRHFYSSEFVVGGGLDCPSRLGKARLEATFLDQEQWRFQWLNDFLELDPGALMSHQKGATEKETGTEFARVTNATTTLALIMCAIKQKRESLVTLADLQESMNTFIKCKLVPTVMAKYPASNFVNARLSKHSDCQEVKDVNILLRPYRLGVATVSIKKSENTAATAAFHLAHHEENVSTPQVSNWPDKLTPHDIEINLSLERYATIGEP